MHRVLEILGLSIAYVAVRTLEILIQHGLERLATDQKVKQEYKQNGRAL